MIEDSITENDDAYGDEIDDFDLPEINIDTTRDQTINQVFEDVEGENKEGEPEQKARKKKKKKRKKRTATPPTFFGTEGVKREAQGQ